MKKIGIFIVLIMVLDLFTNVAFANASQEPDFGPYMREVQRTVKSNWEPPKDYYYLKTTRAVALFKIDKQGNLVKPRIIKSSGYKPFDKAALEAIKLSKPFAPLPKEYKGSSVDIQFTFDYNKYSEQDKEI